MADGRPSHTAELDGLFHRRAPSTTISILRLPHFEQTRRSRHSGTVVAAP